MACHDCVAVPGWGAFIANYDSARYDEERSVFEPPRCMIGFNASVVHNDGLLAQSLMRREGLTFDEAMRFIADNVEAFRQQLSKDCEVSMGRLGHFSRHDGRVEFMPQATPRRSDRYFGLADLDVMTVNALEREQVEDDQVAIVPMGRGQFVRKAVRIAASVVVLLGLGVLLSTPIIVDRNQPDMASLTPEVSAPQPQQLGVTVQQGVVAQPIEPLADKSALAAVGNTSGKYYMVIATLRNQQELDAFKNKYPALVPHMKMLDYKGMTCVYVARSDDYSTLMDLRSELPEPLRDIWIYN